MTLAFAPERIEHWPLARLQPYAKNAKMHGPDQVLRLAASMAEFGWTVPCLVAEDGELIAGHGPILAATQLGLTDAPVIVLGHLAALMASELAAALGEEVTVEAALMQKVLEAHVRAQLDSLADIRSGLG